MSTAKPIIEVKNVTKKFTYRSDRPQYAQKYSR